MEWQYKELKLRLNEIRGNSIERECNERGRLGWEVISVHYLDHLEVRVLFKKLADRSPY